MLLNYRPFFRWAELQWEGWDFFVIFCWLPYENPLLLLYVLLFCWLDVKSWAKAPIILLIWLIFLQKSKPRNHCDSLGTLYIIQGLSFSGSLDLKILLRNWFISVMAFPKKMLNHEWEGILIIYFDPASFSHFI